MNATSNDIRPTTRRDLATAALIVLIAAVMRFGEPGIVQFYHDEAMLSMAAQDMAADKVFPTEGILSSVGIPNPPTSVYVMWLPFRLSNDPLIATIYVEALNVIGVGLLWLLAHRYFGRTVGLLAGLAYALNPWAVLYSRKIWAQDFHTPFLLAALLLGLYGFAEASQGEGAIEAESRESKLTTRRFWAQVFCLPVLLFALQIHFAAWVLLPVYIWLLWTGRRRISRQALVVSLALSALVLLPYAVGFARTLEKDPSRISDMIGRSDVSKGLVINGKALFYVASQASGLNLETWVAPEQPADVLANVPRPAILWLLIGAAVLVGFGSLWMRRHRLSAFVTLWAGLPLAAFTPTWTPVYPHYFIASIPALALLTGMGAAWLVTKSPLALPSSLRPRGSATIRTATLGLFGVALLTQGMWWRGLLRYLDTHSTPNGFTTPLHYTLAVRDELAKHDDVLVVSNGMDVLYHNEAAGWSVMLRGSVRCVRTVQGDGYAVFPEHPFVAAIAPNAPENAVGNLYVTDSPKIFPERPGDGAYRLYAFDRAPTWPGPDMTHTDPVRFDNGVTLTGYHLEPARMYLEWLLPDANPALNYQYAGHFLDAAGERIGQKDTGFWPGRYWCAGDRLITWTDIDLPDGVATLRVSMYVLDKGPSGWQYSSANVLDTLGNLAGQWVDIPFPGREGE